MKIRLKPSMYILETPEGNYRFILTSSRIIQEFSVDELVKKIISTLVTPQTEEYLFSNLREYDSEGIAKCRSALESEGIIEMYDSSIQNKRHEKQISFLSELTGSWSSAMKAQANLESSKIAVFGAGGIGSWMINGLSQIGVGELRIVDPDVVELTNLNRQLYFQNSDIGKPKVEVLQQKIEGTRIKTYQRWVKPGEDLEEIISGCNFVVNCTDSPSVAETTRIISQYTERMSIPYQVSGGYNLHLGMVGPIIVPRKTACFDCFLAHQKAQDENSNLKLIKDIEQTGNLGPVAGAIANIQVMDIFKYLTNTGQFVPNRFAEINFMNLSINWINYKCRPDCKCSINKRILI